MRNLVAVFTGIILVVGLAVVMPEYYSSYYQQPEKQERNTVVNQQPEKQERNTVSTQPPTGDDVKVVLAFNIISNNSLPAWCADVSSILKKYEISDGLAFLPGKIAASYPTCVKLFLNDTNIDIGSSTYNYTNLTSIQDYLTALEEVKLGKIAVDDAGQINSTVFKAPYDLTDQNIYSLLTRSGITADFSYINQYNLYENGQFLRYDLSTFNGSEDPTELLDAISTINEDTAILVNFNNSILVDQIDEYISKLKNADKKIRFINGSELTGQNLTIRR